MKSCSVRMRESKAMTAASPCSPISSGATRLPILLTCGRMPSTCALACRHDHQRNRLVGHVHLMFCSLPLSKRWNWMRLQPVHVVAVAVEDQHGRLHHLDAAAEYGGRLGLGALLGGCCGCCAARRPHRSVRRSVETCSSCLVQCSVRPLSNSSTCGTNSTIASRDSTAPFGEPGRVTIKTFPRVPASDRESTASGRRLPALQAHQLAKTGDFAVQ